MQLLEAPRGLAAPFTVQQLVCARRGLLLTQRSPGMTAVRGSCRKAKTSCFLLIHLSDPLVLCAGRWSMSSPSRSWEAWAHQ